jgi:aerobic carbon-monoxide dehydrogenase medium subunit
MIPASFDYYAAASVDEAIALLRQHGDAAKVLAGGHSLIPIMKLRLAEPGVIVDIGRIAALRGVQVRNGGVAVGALTTHTAVGGSELLAGLAALQEAARAVGDVQVRNRGTLGGSLAHADPGADLPAAVLALDGEIVLTGPNGERTVKADDFFVGLLTSDVGDDEILTEVRFATPPPRSGSAYVKFANPASGYAIVGVAALVALAADGTVASCRVGVTGTGDHAVRATGVETELTGKQPTAENIAAAASSAAAGIDPLEDIHASADYRAELTRVLTRRALTAAAGRAG